MDNIITGPSIYLMREIQERVLEIFHFALRPDGFIFLGSSESAEGMPTLFTPFVPVLFPPLQSALPHCECNAIACFANFLVLAFLDEESSRAIRVLANR